MSEIEELQLFSAVIFPASDPVVIIKETPTYDTGIPPTNFNPRVSTKEFPTNFSFKINFCLIVGALLGFFLV